MKEDVKSNKKAGFKDVMKVIGIVLAVVGLVVFFIQMQSMNSEIKNVTARINELQSTIDDYNYELSKDVKIEDIIVTLKTNREKADETAREVVDAQTRVLNYFGNADDYVMGGEHAEAAKADMLKARNVLDRNLDGDFRIWCASTSWTLTYTPILRYDSDEKIPALFEMRDANGELMGVVTAEFVKDEFRQVVIRYTDAGQKAYKAEQEAKALAGADGHDHGDIPDVVTPDDMTGDGWVEGSEPPAQSDVETKPHVPNKNEEAFNSFLDKLRDPEQQDQYDPTIEAPDLSDSYTGPGQAGGPND